MGLYTAIHRLQTGTLDMGLVNSAHPMRVVIKCKAKIHLQNDPALDEPFLLDEGLFKETASILFRSERYQDLRLSCRSKQEAADIENIVAFELAAIYRQIKLQQQDPMVQKLNQLLS